MKKRILNPLKTLFVSAAFLMVGSVASATTYTAVASGNWSSAATWGGSAAPTNITASDVINIGVGITVTMDQNITLNNALASISVAGALTGNPYIKLDVLSGTLSGSGSINAANVRLSAAGFFNFSGSITADTLTNSIVGLSNSSQITVNDALILDGAVDVMLGGSVTMGANSSINVSGGGLSVSGGTLNLTSTYNVNYSMVSVNAGAELSGSGLGNVTVGVGASNSVTLTSNLTTNGSLNINSGSVNLSGYNLTINGAVTGTPILGGNASSNLTVNTSGGLSTPIEFSSGMQSLNNLTVNVGSGNSVRIFTNLTAGTVSISGGSLLNISNVKLTVNNDLTGNGSLTVNNFTSLNFNTSNSITGRISLVGGGLGKFSLNIGNGNQAVLNGILTVDTLDMASGTLILNRNNLFINAHITAGGTGIIASNSSSSIAVTSASSALGSLSFSATSDTVNNLTVNVTGGSALKIGSDMVVSGTLAFTAGKVDVQNYNMMIGVAGSITGAGANAYVTTGSGGYLTMYVSGSNSATFQVGTASNYFPATISLNSGSSSGTIGLNISSGVYSHGTSGVNISASQPMVDATWLFQNNIGSGLNANMQLSWQASAEVNGFVHTDDYISHYVSAWDDIGDSMNAVLSGGLYTITRANITSMSPFAIFDQTTVPTGMNEIASQANEVILYPNPASSNIYVKNPLGNGAIVYVEVYNTLGQVVTRTQYNNDFLSLPVSSLPEGNYFLKLYNDQMTVVKKFTKL